MLMQVNLRNWPVPAIGGLLLAAVFLVYWPGLPGAFFFDDEPNLLLNEALAISHLDFHTLWTAAFSFNAGPLGRPLSMASFALNQYFAGWDAYYFKLINVLIHLSNGIGILMLSRLVLAACRRRGLDALTERQATWLALGISAVWLLHPLQLTSVLYVVQRMTSLTALFMIAAMIGYLWGRLRLDAGRPGVVLILASFAICYPLAVFSKENGALLPLYLLLLEVVLFRFQGPARCFVTGFFLATLLLPVILAVGWLALHPGWLAAGYAGRDFTLVERLLTEARVLWFYLRLVVLPDERVMGLYHDDFAVSHGLFEPPATLLALAGLAALLGLALSGLRRAPMASLGVLWFFAGHLLESTLIGLELVHEHRNYLPIYGIVLAAGYYLAVPVRVLGSSRTMRAVIGAGLIAFLAAVTAVRAAHYGNPFTWAMNEAQHHPDSPRANHSAGMSLAVLIAEGYLRRADDYATAKAHFERAMALDDEMIEAPLALLNMAYVARRQADPAWVAELQRRLAEAREAGKIPGQLAPMLRQLKSGLPTLPPAEAIPLFQAALANPRLAGAARSEVLTEYSVYLLAQRDLTGALEQAHEAALASPRLAGFHLYYARLLVMHGDAALARKELNLARECDTLKIWQSEIRRLSGELR